MSGPQGRALPAEQRVQRHEEKYLLNAMQAAELRLLLNGLLCRDRYSAAGAYFIRSLYFDTPDDVDYSNKVLGVSQRQKLRLRLYDVNSPSVKLEIKNKRGNLSMKQTASLTRAQAESLIAGGCGFLAREPSDTSRRAYTFLKKEYRRPAALVDYERTAFVSPVAQVRITLDQNIRAAKSDALFDAAVPCVGVHSSGVCVLEVKYDSFLPGYLRGVLSSVNPNRLSVSKYELAREVLY